MTEEGCHNHVHVRDVRQKMLRIGEFEGAPKNCPSLEDELEKSRACIRTRKTASWLIAPQ